jgi:hypothetical protein
MQGFAVVAMVELAVAFLISGSFIATEQSADLKRPISKAIDDFNLTRRSELLRLKQAQLSEDEMIAEIRDWLSKKEASNDALLFNLIARIEQTRILPPKSRFEVTRLSDPGGRYVFNVYNIRLGVQVPNGLGSGIPLRQAFISSRTLQEEVEHLNKVLDEIPRLPGFYRLENRVKGLEKRIKSKNTK